MLLSAEHALVGRVRVYRGATVVDGTGAERYPADVAVEGERIVAVIRPDDPRSLELPDGVVEVDAAGLVLAPGVIDMKVHGVTTLVSGDQDQQDAPWRTMDDLIAEIDPATAANVAVLVSQSSLRTAIIGQGNRASAPAEIEAMCALLGDALDAGAFGVSSDLGAATEAEASTAELEALRRVVAERGGYWSPTAGGRGDTASDAVEAGVEEIVRRLSGVPARRLGLDRTDAPRGVIREGATADLVLFDPDRIVPGATFDDPQVFQDGAVEVLIAGVPVIVGGEATGEAPGRALRMPPPPHRATVPLIEGVTDSQADPFVVDVGTRVSASEGLEGVAEYLRASLGLDRAATPDASSISLHVDDALEDEEFRIEVESTRITLVGGAPVGVFRAVTTLRQLCAPDTAIASRIPAGTWAGKPAYGWRGAMLDVARHFRPAADIRRLIDLLAAHHLNVLHLHLTDDQGWRFEVPDYPRLTEIGARRDATQRGHGPRATIEPGTHEGFYTTDELKHLVAYAAERFVTIVPEVELPGHVQAALAAYPELGNTDLGEPVTAPWERFGVNPRVLAPTEEALAFGRAAIDALCDVFDSPWIGIGGDEVPVDEWAQSAAASRRMHELGLAGPHEVQPWFTRHFVAHVRSRGRTALAWDEVLEGDVPDGVTVLAWRGQVTMTEALRRGIPVIGCPDTHAYLDYRQSESADEPVPVGPPLTIERAYGLSLPDGVVGGQANTWTEHLPTRDRVDFAMFPRLSAIAERLWIGGAAGDPDDFLRRLVVHGERLRAAGVQYRRLDGPSPDQRRPDIPGKPISLADREQIVAELVEGLRLAQTPVRKVN